MMKIICPQTLPNTKNSKPVLKNDRSRRGEGSGSDLARKAEREWEREEELPVSCRFILYQAYYFLSSIFLFQTNIPQSAGGALDESHNVPGARLTRTN